MLHFDKDVEQKFYLAFLEYFKGSEIDFWSECSAPESLATIANNIFTNLMSPITNVFLKNGTKEEYEAAYREYLNKTKI